MKTDRCYLFQLKNQDLPDLQQQERELRVDLPGYLKTCLNIVIALSRHLSMAIICSANTETRQAHRIHNILLRESNLHG